MKNTIRVTSLIALVAAAVLAASVATVSEARADDPPVPPGGSSWGMASPTPEPQPPVQMVPIPDCIHPGTCLPPNIGDNIALAPTPTPQPPTGGGSWGMASPTPTPQPPSTPTPTPVPPSSPTPTPTPNNDGSNNPGGTDNSGGSGSTGGSNNPSGSSNVAGSTNAGGSGNADDSDKSGDPSLPNAGTGTGSSASGGTQSSVILVGLIIAGFAIALALFFTAWRMRRSAR